MADFTIEQGTPQTEQTDRTSSPRPTMQELRAKYRTQSQRPLKRESNLEVNQINAAVEKSVNRAASDTVLDPISDPNLVKINPAIGMTALYLPSGIEIAPQQIRENENSGFSIAVRTGASALMSKCHLMSFSNLVPGANSLINLSVNTVEMPLGPTQINDPELKRNPGCYIEQVSGPRVLFQTSEDLYFDGRYAGSENFSSGTLNLDSAREPFNRLTDFNSPLDYRGISANGDLVGAKYLEAQDKNIPIYKPASGAEVELPTTTVPKESEYTFVKQISPDGNLISGGYGIIERQSDTQYALLWNKKADGSVGELPLNYEDRPKYLSQYSDIASLTNLKDGRVLVTVNTFSEYESGRYVDEAWYGFYSPNSTQLELKKFPGIKVVEKDLFNNGAEVSKKLEPSEMVGEKLPASSLGYASVNYRYKIDSDEEPYRQENVLVNINSGKYILARDLNRALGLQEDPRFTQINSIEKSSDGKSWIVAYSDNIIRYFDISKNPLKDLATLEQTP